MGFITARQYLLFMYYSSINKKENRYWYFKEEQTKKLIEIFLFEVPDKL